MLTYTFLFVPLVVLALLSQRGRSFGYCAELKPLIAKWLKGLAFVGLVAVLALEMFVRSGYEMLYQFVLIGLIQLQLAFTLPRPVWFWRQLAAVGLLVIFVQLITN